MSKASNYEAKTETLITPIVEEMGYELVDVEFVKEGTEYYLRVYIDKEGGVNIDDCVAVSRRFNEILDAEDYIAEAYTFEVSSPGLERPLKKDKDFARSIGKQVLVKTYKQIDKQKEFTGELVSYDGATVTIRREDESMMEFVKEDISLIRLAFTFDI